MPNRFQQIMLTPAILAAQEHYYARPAAVTGSPEFDPLTDEEREFIAARGSFYMATLTETGWPYVQHRGGKPGFLRVLGLTTLAFADFGGNRQLLTERIRGMETKRNGLFPDDFWMRGTAAALGIATLPAIRADSL